MKNENLSYGELAALSELFDEQVKERGIIFPDEDQYTGAWLDFCEQYQQGDMNPQINCLEGVTEGNF